MTDNQDSGRRRFLARSLSAAALGGVGLLGGYRLFLHPWLRKQGRNPASASDAPHFFVLITMDGGMDVTLGLDAQTLPEGADSQDLFLEYRPEDILRPAGTADAYKLAPAASALAPFADRTALIHGVMMRRDAGHSSLQDYICCGRNGRADLSVELNATHGTSPLGVLFNDGAVAQGNRSAILSRIGDLRTPQQNLTLPYLQNPSESGGFRSSAVSHAAIQQRLTRFHQSLEPHGGIQAASEMHLIAAAFKEGLAQQSHYNLRIDADTHADHEGKHLEAQKSKGWDEVAKFLSIFSQTQFGESNLLDYTTVMVVTEFSRTPALNAARGKDHNPFTNSVLLAGKGIRGGSVTGASRLITRRQHSSGMSQHVAVPFDYRTQTLAQNAESASYIFPENVARTIAKIFGDPQGFASVDLSTTQALDSLIRT